MLVACIPSVFTDYCPLTTGYCSESHLRDSNPGLQLYESCALPTELRWLLPIRLVPAPSSTKRGFRLAEAVGCRLSYGGGIAANF